MHTHTHTHTHTHFADTHTHLHTHKHTNKSTHKNTHLSTHTHTSTHTLKHTQTHRRLCRMGMVITSISEQRDCYCKCVSVRQNNHHNNTNNSSNNDEYIMIMIVIIIIAFITGLNISVQFPACENRSWPLNSTSSADTVPAMIAMRLHVASNHIILRDVDISMRDGTHRNE